MSKGKFNILDAPYWEALRDAVTSIERHQLPYAVVGGAAAQIWCAFLLTDGGRSGIEQSSELSLRLRTTKDVDLSARVEAHEMLQVLNEFAATSGGPAFVLSARAVRLGQVFINITIDADDISGFEDSFDEIIDSSQALTLRRGQENLSLKVESLEFLIFTKLTRKGKQAKDLVDLDSLCACLLDANKSVSVSSILKLTKGTQNAGALLLSYKERYPEVFAE